MMYRILPFLLVSFFAMTDRASAQPPSADAAPDTATTLSLERDVDRSPSLDLRRAVYENRHRRGRRTGFVAAGFAGAGALGVGLSFAIGLPGTDSPHSIPVWMVAALGSATFAGLALPIGLAGGGVMLRSRYRLEELAPIVSWDGGRGFIVGVRATY